MEAGGKWRVCCHGNQGAWGFQGGGSDPQWSWGTEWDKDQEVTKWPLVALTLRQQTAGDKSWTGVSWAEDPTRKWSCRLQPFISVTFAGRESRDRRQYLEGKWDQGKILSYLQWEILRCAWVPVWINQCLEGLIEGTEEGRGSVAWKEPGLQLI